MQQSDIESALDVLRPSLDADGFTLRFGAIEDSGIVQVVLEAKPQACLECLVPEELMVQVIENAIRERFPTLVRVELLKSGFDAITHDSGNSK